MREISRGASRWVRIICLRFCYARACTIRTVLRGGVSPRRALTRITQSRKLQGLSSEDRHRWESDFSDFIRKFQMGEVFPYRELLRKNTAMYEHKLEVNMDHLQTFNSELHDELRDKPAELMPLFERAAKSVYEGMLVGRRAAREDLPTIQVILTSSCAPVGMRELSAMDYSKLTTVLVCVRGHVV